MTRRKRTVVMVGAAVGRLLFSQISTYRLFAEADMSAAANPKVRCQTILPSRLAT